MKSIFTNLSGDTRVYGYLPPHGLKLDDNESVSFEGNLRTILAGKKRYSRDREVDALQRDIDAGNSELMLVDDVALAPTYTSLTPVFGSINGEDVITITGTGFVPGTAVTFDGDDATDVTVVDSTTLTCKTPSASFTGSAVDVVVTNPDGQDDTGAAAYTYTTLVIVTSASPNNGKLASGTSVTITGSGFITGASVTFGATPATGVTVVSATSITCTAPAHALGSVAITVTNGVSGAVGTGLSAYTYNPVPTFTSIVANTGSTAGGTHVTITGTGFTTGVAVTFGVTAATSIVRVSSTSITCDTPAHSAGAVNVVVTNLDTQSITGTGAFTYS